MVTVTPHLPHAIGLLALSNENDRGVFQTILEAETAVPAKRTVTFSTPKDGGDVLIKICEGVRDIKVTKPERKPKTNGEAKKEDDEDDDDDEGDSEDEEEEIREKAWNVENILAEIGIKGVKKGGKVEVMVNVNAELGVQVTAREVGEKSGVRGTLEKPSKQVLENGSA